MAKCFNRNTKGYKELLEDHGDTLTVDLLINDWQDYTGSDTIPGKSEIKDMQNNDELMFSLRSQSLRDSLLRNLANKNIISKYNNKWYVNVTIPGKTEGKSTYVSDNVSRLKSYVKNQNLGNVVSLKRTRSTYEVIVNTDLFTKQDLIKERIFTEPTKIPSILNHLTSIFPELKVRYMTPSQAEEAYNELPSYTKKKVNFANVKSFYWNGNAVLIKGRVTEDTAVEEVLHPFINTLKASKPRLFSKVLAEAKKTFPVLAQQIERSYSDKKGFSVKARDLELVTQSLSRHFNKEYENNPTRPWYTVVSDLLKWFSDIIKKVYKDYMGGRLKLKVGFISSEMNLSDIAKMLNTSEFSFDMGLMENGDRKVQYSLSENKQRLVDIVRDQSLTDTQLQIVDRLLHQVEDTDDIFDSLGTSRVILDESSGDFVDLDKAGEVYNSLETILEGKSAKDNLAHLVEEILLDEVGDWGIALGARLEGMREDGSILLPGVILSDTDSSIATMATVLRIKPDGSITVIDIKKTGDVESVKQATFINTQRRILENLGYDVTDRSFTIVLDYKNQYKNTITHFDSQNTQAVEDIVPENVDTDNRDIIGEILGKERNLEGTNPVEDITDELEPEFLDSPTYDSIFLGLKTFRKTLVSRENATKTARNYMSMDKGRQDIIEEIQMTRQLVEQMYETPDEIQRIYVDVLQDVIKQVKDFQKYSTDPENFGKDEFISKILNWKKFVESFRGLVNLTGDLKGMNPTANKYKNILTNVLNDLVGIKRVSDDSIVTKGIFDIAIANHVREIIKNKSNRDFTPAQLEELMTSATDINAAEYQTGDMATSRDTILALMDKIYKRDRQRVLDKIEARAPRIRSAALKLARLNYGKTIDYSFMLEFDENGDFTGRYVKRTGKLYFDKQREIYDKLYDENGQKKYITIDNIEDATEKQLEYNKQLARDKKEFGKFMSAETRTEEGVEDGEYHSYTKEFKEARLENEVYIYNVRSEVGRWVKRNSVSKKDYRKFINRYYDTLDDYERVQNDKNGDPTGVTEIIEGINVVKREYTQKNNTISNKADGKSMINPKWAKLQDPKTELEIAQSEYYNMFISVYEDELMDKLPENINMVGKAPIIHGETTSKMKNKSNIISKIYTGFKRWGGNLINPTTTIKKVFNDEHGNIITNSLPLFFTGGAKSDEYLKELNDVVLAKEAEYNNAETQAARDNIKEQLKAARGRLQSAESAPTKSQLSMDMTDSLLQFSAMAENYETMAAAEDTHLAMVKVLKDRSYKNSKGTLKAGDEARMTARAKKWMKMVFYNNDGDVKTFWDKLTSGLISYTSLAYVGTNVFGNINNYSFGRISNLLETYGQRFYTRKAMAKAVIGFNKRMIPDFMISLGKVSQDNLITGKKLASKGAEFREDIPHSKYGAMVAFFRMMDPKADMREQGDVSDMWNKYTSWTYALQDAGEFNVQTKVGMAVLHSTEAINPETGATMSLFDAINFDRKSGDVTIKEGFTEIKMYNAEKTMKWDADAKYEIRNYIRETNKVTHGNYAYEDRMVMQSNSLGQLAAQFHKWVAPGLKARFRSEYFDENLGWMEGRYLTFWNFLGYAYKNIGEIQKMSSNYKEFHGEKGQVKLQNVHRVMGEIAIIFGTWLTKQLLMTMWGMNPDDDDDSDMFDPMFAEPGDEVEVSNLTKRLRNILVYQMDRLHDETIMFVPIAPGGLEQMGHFIQNPIASSRTLGEIGQAISMTAKTGIYKAFQSDEAFMTNTDIVYTRGTRAGQMKLGKEWRDATPFLLTINKWENFINMNDFYIK